MKLYTLLLILLSSSAFAQNGSVVIDCGGLHTSPRGKLVSAEKIPADEVAQIKKADEDFAEAKKVHDAALNKIKAAHGQTALCAGMAYCYKGTDIVFADDFVLVYKWENDVTAIW